MDKIDYAKTYADVETGEIIEGVITSVDDLKKRQDSKQSTATYLKRKNEFTEYLTDHFGTFFFHNYRRRLQNTSLMFKFIYLCTFADYDGMIHVHNRLATLKDLPELLRVYSGGITAIKNALLQNELITLDDNQHLRVNDEYYVRGKLRRKDKGNSVRIFDRGIQELYLNAKLSDHKRIGYLLPLLPYVNAHLNIVCHNTYERDPQKIKPLTLREICNIIDYDYDHYYNLNKFMLTTSIGGYPLFMRTSQDFYLVNPRLFYKGSYSADLRTIAKLFEVNNTNKGNSQKTPIA